MPKFRPGEDNAPQKIMRKMPRCEIIADVGSNHKGDYQRAYKIIEKAAQAGVDTVKFQFWGMGELWRANDDRCNTTDKYALPEKWLEGLRGKCIEQGVEFLVTPFSIWAANVLTKLRVKRYKIASGDVTFLPMLEEIRKTGIPIIMSIGGAEEAEVEKALLTLRPLDVSNDITLLHCIPTYPTRPEHANLRYILDIKEQYGLKYGTHVGLSSHMREWWCDLPALAYGIQVIEKHIDLDGTGPESEHSLTPDQMAQFVSAVRQVESALDYRNFFIEGEEYARKHYRRDESDWLRPRLK